jgi:hypothetical protein
LWWFFIWVVWNSALSVLAWQQLKELVVVVPFGGME